ncbi:MBL fold metallo-hydrolase [Dehalogenimonas sp. THU2]|uniref:MBL fold metallo-hydrolase n=1 Tax=Dehalogenimonas sp. THU2 TaxID=3151121 RepID=UPI0032185BA6
MIIERLIVGPIQANCYIVADEGSREGLVIDPGADAATILKRVLQLGLKIKYIILTHSHFDHVAATGAVKKATGAKLAIHEADAGSLNDGLLARLAGIVTEKAPPPDMLLKGWEKFTIGKIDFTVLHVPGHSPGGIALYGADVVFTGDSLFEESIGRTDLPGGDYATLIDNLNTRLMALDDAIKVYPGHGPDTTIGTERRGNPFLVNPPRREC